MALALLAGAYWLMWGGTSAGSQYLQAYWAVGEGGDRGGWVGIAMCVCGGGDAYCVLISTLFLLLLEFLPRLQLCSR